MQQKLHLLHFAAFCSACTEVTNFYYRIMPTCEIQKPMVFKLNIQSFYHDNLIETKLYELVRGYKVRDTEKRGGWE